MGLLARAAARIGSGKLGPAYSKRGCCPVCERPTRFRSFDEAYRDHLVCRRCRSLPRERALLLALADVRPDWRGGRIHESSPAGPASRKLQAEARHYVPSRYEPTAGLGARLPDGMRNEDLQSQTFPDGAFDLVVTQDVFEHIVEPERAIEEIARTLAPGGVHVCTTPLVNGPKPSFRRVARSAAGGLELLAPAVYHEDPFLKTGSLVTMDWGYDVAGLFQQASGMSTVVLAFRDEGSGVIGPLTEVVVSFRG